MDPELVSRCELARQHRLNEEELKQLLSELRATRIGALADTVAATKKFIRHASASAALLSDVRGEIDRLPRSPATETLEAYFCTKCHKKFGSYDYAVHRRDRLCHK